MSCFLGKHWSVVRLGVALVMAACSENAVTSGSPAGAGGGGAGGTASAGAASVGGSFSGTGGAAGQPSTNPCARPDAPNPDDPCAGLGIFDECLQHGQSFDRRFAGDPCCEGLSLTPLIPLGGLAPPGLDIPPGCGLGAPAVFICLTCGDGMCTPPENHCVCSQDCPAPDAGANDAGD